MPKLVSYGEVLFALIISVVLMSYIEQILRQLSAQCAFNFKFNTLMAGREREDLGTVYLSMNQKLILIQLHSIRTTA